MPDAAPSPRLPLGGIRVIDVATVVAGPGVTARLGDFGADVIKVEHPQKGDPVRSMGWEADGATLWSKWLGRNKRPVTLDLSHPKGQRLLLRLVETADVLVESFRAGTLERWNLAPDTLLERNRRLVVLRVSGFGQTGPYRRRPGFGTLAEAMSGLAHMTGFPDGPPVLPPVALADEVSALLGAFAVMVALYARDTRDAPGQVIDLSLVEALFQITGPLPALYERLGVVPGRIGNRIAYAAPRGTYPTEDGRWVGISGTSPAVAERTFAAIERPELAKDPRFVTNAARVANVQELDEAIEEWTSRHTLDEVLDTFERHEAAAAPVYDIADIASDPHFAERETIVRVPDGDLDPFPMADVQPGLSATPGRIRHAGRPKGSANEEVFADELHLTSQERVALADEGVI
jgi:crotonobetainyl-CoA:carnitine CoA-transferase CaiB-like acyl-CoA transferase